MTIFLQTRPRVSRKEKKSRQFVLEAKDKKYVWHPFTQMQDWEKSKIVIVEKANGVYLQDVEGKTYIDGVSSLWCNIHGHRVPEIDQALIDQMGKVAHSTFLGLSNSPAIELAEELIEIVPSKLKRVFYSDSGSEAVEVALKIAYQYWQQLGNKSKNKFVKLSQAYHGDTLGSVSVGGIDLFHQIYKPLLFPSYTVTTIEELEKLLKSKHREITAFVMEPLMQGACGMLPQPKGFISKARGITKKYGVLLIFDEVATGFGRTGKMFACDHEKVSPDILVVAKGLTGGYLPLSATITTEEIYKAFLGKYEEFKTFFHGHTYTANPLACAAALAALKLFRKNKTLQKLQPKIKFLTKRLKDFYQIPIVGDIRQVGFMVGIELFQNPKTKKPFDPKHQIGHQVILKAREKGAILRPLGPVVVLMPPLSISMNELKRLLDITYESIDDIANEAAYL